MRKFTSLLLMFFPSFIQVPLRRLGGQKIGKGSRIRFGTILFSSSVDIGKDVTIGPFCFIRTESLVVGDYSSIKALSLISTRIIRFGQYVHIAPLAIISSEFTENSRIEIGDHSRVFPFSWMDTGEGITVGKQSSVGTHVLIYTHGTWSDYLNGAPVTYGPVVIEDNVYVSTRITILPNVVIGANTIIGASSLVNKSFPKNVMIAGTPARIVKENLVTELEPELKLKRGKEILDGFAKYMEFKYKMKVGREENCLIFNSCKIILDDMAQVSSGDLLVLLNTGLTGEQLEKLGENQISVLDHKNKTIVLNGTRAGKNIVFTDFIAYVRRYGVRLYIIKK
jgi:acetyltransferase-like isoleucine patch superfamily enzyme